MSRRPFTEFKNNYFVESGTYFGEGIEEALVAGFKNIISYEVYGPIYIEAVKKFQRYDNIRLLFKSSVEMFDEISQIHEQITFWLDGHYSSGYTSYELEAIEKHPIKSHTICIDDRRLMSKSDINTPDNIGVTEDEVIKALYKINPNYKIEYRDGHIKDDVIVAYI
jgi:hypothetical protein